MNFTIDGPLTGRSKVCTPILRTLPEWFGIEESLQKYASEIEHLPTFLASHAGQVVGFLSIKQHFSQSAEVYVMGILSAAQRKGIGQSLILEAESWLRENRVEYLQVKTLAPSNDDPNYAKTRAFYLALGFKPLEEFSQIWDQSNPCLIMVKRL